MPEKLLDLKTRLGISGVILPPSDFPRDVRNLQTLSNIAPPSFVFFSALNHANAQSLASVDCVNSILEFSEEKSVHLHNRMKQHVEGGIKTMLSIPDSMYDREPISIANQVATLIDLTGGVDYVWLSGSSDLDADDVVRLCEELAYLDVAGPTIKSRLVVDSSDAEVVEETMFAGVNKFVIENEDQVSIVEEVATEQGKRISR